MDFACRIPWLGCHVETSTEGVHGAHLYVYANDGDRLVVVVEGRRTLHGLHESVLDELARREPAGKFDLDALREFWTETAQKYQRGRQEAA